MDIPNNYHDLDLYVDLYYKVIYTAVRILFCLRVVRVEM